MQGGDTLMQDKHVYVMLSESGLVKIGISQM